MHGRLFLAFKNSASRKVDRETVKSVSFQGIIKPTGLNYELKKNFEMGSCCVVQAALKLTILLPEPLKFWGGEGWGQC